MLYCTGFGFDNWSESDDEEQVDMPNADPTQRIHVLERKLERAKQQLADYRALVARRLNVASVIEGIDDENSSLPTKPRDDDAHYFQSYGENGLSCSHSSLI